MVSTVPAVERFDGRSAETARPVFLEDRRSSLTEISMTAAVAEALDALLLLRTEHGALAPADVADAVITHDLDEAEAEALAHELECTTSPRTRKRSPSST